MSVSDEVKQLEEMNKKMDKTLEAATAAQATASKLEKGKADTDATVQKALEESTKFMEEAQNLRQEIKSFDKAQKYLEKMVARMGGSGSQENQEKSEQAGQEMAAYLRSGTEIKAETVEDVVRSLCTKSFHGIDVNRRDAEIKTLIAGNNTTGGYFIRPERSAKMIKRIFETSPIRNFANIETTSTDTFEILIDDEEASAGGWVGETSSRGVTDTPGVGMLTIPVAEMFAQPKATQKMLDNAGFDIESWLAGKVTRKLTRLENTAFVSGDGSAKPKGFLALDAWTTNGTYQRNAIEQIDSGINGVFTADTIKDIQNSLIEEYQASAIWGLKRASFQQIITLKDGTGAYLLDPRSMKVGDTLVLLGKEVVFMNDIPAIATDALAMVYGDMNAGYTIIDRMGFRVLRDELTDKPFTKFYTTKSVGGAPSSYEALKLMKLAA